MGTTASRPGGPTLSVSSRLLGTGTLWEAAEAAARLGYGGVELWANPIGNWFSARATARRLAAVSVRRYMHVPFHDLNACSANLRIRRVSRDEIRRSLRTASALGIRQVVMHPGRVSNTKGDTDGIWPVLVESLVDLCSYADRRGIRVAVEAMERRPKELLVGPEDMARLFSEAPSLKAGVCLDLAHAWTVDPTCADRFIQTLGERIIHVHFSHVSEGRIHLPLDRGQSPVTPSAAHFLRNFGGPITLEGAGRAWPHAAEVGIGVMRRLFFEEGGDASSQDPAGQAG